MYPNYLVAEAQSLIAALRNKGLRLATAESCTGGLISGLVTEVAGASDVFERGFVTYSNAAKIGQLGVDLELLNNKGAVSAEVAAAMAQGAIAASAADLAVSVTGIAGPGGGTAEKPVGLVFIATAAKGRMPRVTEFRFGNESRSEIRLRTTAEALRLLASELERSWPISN